MSLGLLLSGCHAAALEGPHWQVPRESVRRLWTERSRHTERCALLAAVHYEGPPENRSFTLEIFFRQPDEFHLRGRGTLGVEGFRARVRADTLVLLLDRQKRGFAGPADSLPQDTRTLWRLLREALPWVVGVRDALDSAQVDYARPDRPKRLRVANDSTQLVIEYARYRNEYPYWHLRTAMGRTPQATLHLEFRQQLYNPPLDSPLFELELPPGTRPLVD